ncbi:nitroreductase family protein [Saccharothrix coeruleofusca]|uniref:Oxidoreductase n=1 Tax=Saccharothrix coeruleofusca TaxID=33919 RepID=A0A918EHY1_9PSEU|nr:nitroreductase family protein [Saccharothrix coeruleofusca]MBP2337324.1 nitroreductase [Saccharothrix coeruleofusca]GGP81473.1 oxidoreductase [Saccharothrix coeruleofusca]
MNIDVASVDHVLSTTRAVRRKLDLDRPVEEEVLTTCLRLSTYAPSPGNQQQWRWIVVRDAERRKQLGELFREVGQVYLEQTRERLGAAVDYPPVRRMITSVQHLVDVIDRVPVFVIPCVQGPRPSGNVESTSFYGGIYPAVWSFQLALRARGLGTVLTTLHLHREAEAARILGLPADVTQVGLLPVAYTTTTDFRPPVRQPLEAVAFLDTWGHPLC